MTDLTPQMREMAEIGQDAAAVLAAVLAGDDLGWTLVRDHGDRVTLLTHCLLVLAEVADDSGARNRLLHFARLKAARLAGMTAE